MLAAFIFGGVASFFAGSCIVNKEWGHAGIIFALISISYAIQGGV